MRALAVLQKVELLLPGNGLASTTLVSRWGAAAPTVGLLLIASIVIGIVWAVRIAGRQSHRVAV